MTDPDAAPFDLVLFDLGGVLLQVGGVTYVRALGGFDSDEEVWKRWLTCDWVRRFERGLCDVEAFATGVVTDWELPVTAEEFTASFRGWAVGEFPGAAELVAEVRSRTTVGCLSNSNTLHWEEHQAWGVAGWFDHVFLSHEMDLIKPDPEVFDHVAAAVDLAPHRILFLDDNALNVDAAITQGYRAQLVKGVEDTRAARAAVRILDDP